MRFIRLLLNWVFILSAPIWFIPVFLALVFMVLSNPERDPEHYDIITGKVWII